MEVRPDFIRTQDMGSAVDLLSLPLPDVKNVLGHHIEVETKARTKYVVGTLESVRLDGFDVSRDDGVVVHLFWEDVKGALVEVTKRAG